MIPAKFKTNVLSSLDLTLFQSLRLALNDPIVRTRIQHGLVVVILLSLMVYAVFYFQSDSEKIAKLNRKQRKAAAEEFKSEREELEAAISEGDVDTLFRFARDKRDRWTSSFAERLEASRDRIRVAERLMELPVEPHVSRMAEVAFLRGLIAEQTIYRLHSVVPESRSDALKQAMVKSYDQDREQIKNLVAAAASLVALAEILDTDSEEISDDQIYDARIKLESAAKLNRNDIEIANTHFFWMDWIRTKYGDNFSKPLVDAMGTQYTKSERDNIRDNMRRVLLSMDNDERSDADPNESDRK